MKNFISKSICLIVLFAMAIPFTSQAQQNDEKKVSKKMVIIKEYTDENGEKVVEKIVKEGDDIDNKITIDGDKIIIQNDDNDGDEDQEIRIRVEKKSGSKFGPGSNDMDVDIEENDGEYTINLRRSGEGGKEVHAFKWNDEEGLSEEEKKKLEEMGFEWDEEGKINFKGMKGDGDHNVFFFDKGRGSDRPFLGIVMGEKEERENGVITREGTSDLGVPLLEVVKGSAAEVAGLKEGDIITHLNGQKVANIQEVTNIIKGAKIDDELSIDYIRDNQKNSTKAILKKKIDNRQGFAPNQHRSFYKRGARRSHPPMRWQNHFEERRPCVFIGVRTSSMSLQHLKTEQQPGARVMSIIDNTPAVVAGLQKGDIITALAGNPVANHRELLIARDKHKPGEEVTISFIRDGQNQSTQLTFDMCDNEEKTFGQNRIERKTIIIKKKKQEEVVEDTPRLDIPNSTLQLENFQAYPNPAFGRATVRFEAQPEPISVRVLDIDGKELYSDVLSNFNGSYAQEIDFSNAPSGTLLIVVQQGDKVFTEKIVNNNTAGLRP